LRVIYLFLNLLAAGSAIFGGKTKFYINLKHDLIKFVSLQNPLHPWLPLKKENTSL